MEQKELDLIYLLSCALNCTVPEKSRLLNMDFRSIYNESRRHCVSSAVYCAIESAGEAEKTLGDLYLKWKENSAKAMRKIVLLDAERAHIFKFFEERGIWYMPLKGVILKDYYPKYWMREMSDNDILIDENYRREVARFMKSRGYDCTTGKGNDDEFLKAPVYNFEIHGALFNDVEHYDWCKYYENLKDRLIKDENNAYGFHFTDEDMYIYTSLHEYKHYKKGGIGLKTLADRYVFLAKKAETLDWEYINRQLSKLSIKDYDDMMRNLSDAVFTGKSLSARCAFSLEYMFKAGAYGSIENLTKSRLQSSKSKSKYILNRLFPPLDWYKLYQPFYYKNRYLIPFYVVYRVARTVLFRRKRLSEELHTLRKEKVEK